MVSAQHGIPVDSMTLKLSANDVLLRNESLLSNLNIHHGDMLVLDSPVAANIAPQVKKVVDADGNVTATSKTDVQAGFRPGLSSLRAQKLHWTLTEMTELDDQYTFVIKGKEPLFCGNVSMDLASAESFQAYLRQFGFRRPRIGILYGQFVPTDNNNKNEFSGTRKYGETKGAKRVSDFDPNEDTKPKFTTRVDCIYEPAQDLDEFGNARLTTTTNDPRQERADRVAHGLGLRRVGIMFSHQPGREGFEFSASEIITCGMACLDATDGARDSPFVCLVVKPDDKGGSASLHAYQLKTTCLDMVAEEALLVMPGRPGFAAVRETFSAVVEAKAAEVVDTSYLIKVVPILSHKSPITWLGFPKLNREVGGPDLSALRRVVAAESKKNPFGLARALTDFDLLMFLGEGMDLDSVALIANEVRPLAYGPKEDVSELSEGFALMVHEVAGV
jgi:hypothetical protein